MRTVRLPDIQADNFLIMCHRSDGWNYIKTKRCKSLQVGSDVHHLTVIPLKGSERVGQFVQIPLESICLTDAVNVAVVR